MRPPPRRAMPRSPTQAAVIAVRERPARANLTRSGGHSQAHQSGRIGLAFDAPHRRDQPGSVDKRGAVGSQLSHLAVEFGIAHRPARRAAAVPDMLALLRPVGEMQRHGRRLDRRAPIFFEDNPRAQRAHGRVGDAIVLVLREPGSAKEERCGDGVRWLNLSIVLQSLKAKFPASWENTGNFVRLGLRVRLLARNLGPNSMAYGPIPYASEQGIYFGLAGN